MRTTLLTFCFLAGCSAFGPRGLYDTHGGKERKLCGTAEYVISENVPEGERQAIHDAFRYWDNLSPWELFKFGGYTKESSETIRKESAIVVGYVQTSVVVEYQGVVEHEVYASVRRPYSASNGCMFGVSLMLKTSLSEMSPQVRSAVLRHEVGHVLGLNHTAWDDELMHRSIRSKDPVQEVSQFEWEAFKEFY